MSKTDEFLSDLVDDQCSSNDLDSLLNDKNNIARWHRYSAVSEILKGEYSANASTEFCAEISAKIAEEPAIIAVPRPVDVKVESEVRSATAEVKKFSGGLAIAASFAFATFFSVQTLQVSDDLTPTNTSTAEASLPFTSHVVAKPDIQSLPVDTENSLEQIELEFFNEMFMSRARESERNSIAPFARRVGAEYVKTLRFSAEKWQEILQQNAKNKADAANQTAVDKFETELPSEASQSKQ